MRFYFVKNDFRDGGNMKEIVKEERRKGNVFGGKGETKKEI